MATIQSVKTKIQGLIDLANEKTSNNDTTLTSAVNSLVQGYGQGGASVNVVNVNFYNYDGTLLYTKPTIKGDDCVDVVAKGLVEPYKESTNTLDFTHSGWSYENDGTVDSDALETVNSDRNLYACYSSSTRLYTVKFYSDGALIDTVQVQYGGTATHDVITKDGYKIGSYTPSNENITSDVDITINWVVDDGIIYDDWSTIASYCNDGTYANRYKVGSVKDLEINYGNGSGEIIPMKLVEINPTYDMLYSDTTKKAHLVFIAESLLKDNQRIVNSAYAYPFSDTYAYSYLNNTFINYVPENLRSNLLDVTNGSSNRKGKIWIPNSIELGEDYASTLSTLTHYNKLGSRYSGCINSDSERIRTKVGSEEGIMYPTRRMYEQGASKPYLIGIGATGAYGTYNVSTSTYPILIGFCL